MISAEKAREETNKINKTDVTVQKIIDELDTKIKEAIVKGEHFVSIQREMEKYIKEKLE